jgi:N-acyl-phosphatidylethanolamine-hydrolysing phospholipase D
MNKKYYYAAIFLLQLIYLSSCNQFYIAIRNVPVFFSSPEPVKNKINNPIDSNNRLSALWIGHATVLIQMDDKVIITDPVFTETIGELARRVVEPGIDNENIPKCDAILISHSHFDHLSLGSLSILEEKSKGASLIFPEGIEDYLPDYVFNFVKMKNNHGYKNKLIGETKIINGLKITTVAARHWAGRYVLDGYLWGNSGFTGYIIEYNGMTVYFSGDTGYDSATFKYLGDNYKIDLALIPIGPCAECNQEGTKNHVFPPASINIFIDTKAKWLIPIHYGTFIFQQAENNIELSTFLPLVKEKHLENSVFTLKVGEQKVFISK